MNRHISSIRILVPALLFYVILASSAILIVSLSGCATKTIYEPTYIPVRTDIPMPALKPKSNNTAQNVKQILEYSTELECDLLYTTRGQKCN